MIVSKHVWTTHCRVEIDFRKDWTKMAQEVGIDVIETCLDTARLKLMLAKDWTKVAQKVGL